MSGVPHNLMRGRCQFCGRTLRYANIPNRGPVMAHAKGDGAHCQGLIQRGQDLVSREARRIADKAEHERRLAELRARLRP